MIRINIPVFVVFFLFVFGEQVTSSTNPRILLMGDSMMSWNRVANKSVANVIEAALGKEVADRSVPGARYFYQLPISGSFGLRLTEQYRQGDWDWVVLNGGGNDLLLGCGCSRCDRMLNRLVSRDGRSGTIPEFVSRIGSSGAKVIYVGYLRSPGVKSSIDVCKAAGDELDRRLTKMAHAFTDVVFISMANLVPAGDRSFHQKDMVHPSIKGSQKIGERILRQIKP